MTSPAAPALSVRALRAASSLAFISSSVSQRVMDSDLPARASVGLPEDSVASELLASFLEARSPIYDTVAELATELPALRRRVRDLAAGCGARLAAAGTHPFSEATTQPITEHERYRKVESEMGWTARMQA